MHGDPWRNGSASDSRSEGCVFDSRRVQTPEKYSEIPIFFYLFTFLYETARRRVEIRRNVTHGR